MCVVDLKNNCRADETSESQSLHRSGPGLQLQKSEKLDGSEGEYVTRSFERCRMCAVVGQAVIERGVL